MKFEWDSNKEQKNIKAHGIDFETAKLVFLDNHRIERYDYKHSINEDRYIIIGMIDQTPFMLFVVFTERGDVTRIISAREATKEERNEYNDHQKRTGFI